MTAIRRILVFTDFSEASKVSLAWAAGWAMDWMAELHLVHVLEERKFLARFVHEGAPFEPTAIIEKIIEDLKGDMDRIEKGLPSNLEVRSHLRRGVVLTEILATIKEIKADLLVLHLPPKSGLTQLFHHSLAEKIIPESPCPVLIVPIKPSAPSSHQHRKGNEDDKYPN